MPRIRKPAYLHHKATGQARVRIDGRDHYLGQYGSPESRQRYDELISQWFARQGDPHLLDLTIDDLALLYLDFAEGYYRKNGRATREFDNIRSALRLIVRSFGTTKVSNFGPRKLRQFRDDLIRKPDGRMKSRDTHCISRSYINKLVGKVVRMFKWAASEELVPVTTFQALVAVEGLKKGRSDARETPPVRPVEDTDVNAVIPLVVPQVAAMIELQRLTGMRPGDVTLVRPCDISMRTDGVWSYRPHSHKTEHHEVERVVVIGPKGQAILRPWLNRGPDEYCFSPREAVQASNARKRLSRKTRVQPSQLNRRKSNPKRKPDTQRGPIARQFNGRATRQGSPFGVRTSYVTASAHAFGANLGWKPPKSRSVTQGQTSRRSIQSGIFLSPSEWPKVSDDSQRDFSPETRHKQLSRGLPAKPSNTSPCSRALLCAQPLRAESPTKATPDGDLPVTWTAALITGSLLAVLLTLALVREVRARRALRHLLLRLFDSWRKRHEKDPGRQNAATRDDTLDSRPEAQAPSERPF